MSKSPRSVLVLLLCALLTTGCADSVFPIKRGPPPEELLRKPAAPALAPDDATDNEIAEERIRFGEAYRVLERKFDDAVRWIQERFPPASPAPAAGERR